MYSKDSKKKKKRKPYEKPTATRLTPEEAKEKLRRLAEQGSQDAKEMLRTMFPEGRQGNSDDDLNEKKKSA